MFQFLIVIVCVLILNCVYMCTTEKELSFSATQICSVKCFPLENDSETDLVQDQCKNQCINNQEKIIKEDNIETNLGLEPKLHCKSETDISLEWKILNNEYYFLELRDEQSDWIPTAKITETNYTFTFLKPNTKYQSRIWVLNRENNEINGLTVSQWISTLEEDFQPKPVENISLVELKLNGGEYFEALIQWVPNKEYQSCFYDLVKFSDSDNSNFEQEEYKTTSERFEVVFDHLEFNTNYSIAIMAKSSNWQRESTKMWMDFFTPSCLEAHADLKICPPTIPVNVTPNEIVSEVTYKDNIEIILYDVTVTWSLPKFIPDYYEVTLYCQLSNIMNNYTKLNATVAGTETQVVFHQVDVGFQYQILVTAHSVAGQSEPAFLIRQISHPQISTLRKQPTWIVIITILVTITTLSLFAFGFYIYRRRLRQKRYEQRCKYFEELEEKAPKSIDCITNDMTLILGDELEPDKWELYPERLILQDVLGEGAFGFVRRAWLKDEKGTDSIEVAVKMLKDSPTPEQKNNFVHEIDIMKTVGVHPNLVSILGCCTRPRSGHNLMLVVEYCPLGDLQNYLRDAWDQMTLQTEQKIHYSDLILSSNDNKLNFISNKLYDLENDFDLQPNDLLSFARQIIIGMEYLTNLKVLHRDLAARNVLVCTNKKVKIADFGLSRDVYKDNMYRKTGNGKLPFRWMAIESLTHQIYTSQSDVWSFGILLWEIVTLGANPYPSIPTNNLIKLLRSGYRMEQPSNCGFELYTIMLSCWKAIPKDRPTFTDLKKSLDLLIENETNAKYLDLNMHQISNSFRFIYH